MPPSGERDSLHIGARYTHDTILSQWSQLDTFPALADGTRASSERRPTGRRRLACAARYSVQYSPCPCP